MNGGRQRLLYWAVVYVSLAAALTTLHAWRVDVPFREEQKRWHAEILAGTAPHPYNARILQPLAVEAACRMVPQKLRDDTFTAGYAGFRVASLLATFVAFELFLLSFPGLLRLDVARLVVLFVASLYPLGFCGYHYQPTSPLDLALFTIGLLLIVRQRDPWLLPLMLVATMNRNTSIFLLAVYLLWRWPELRGRGRRVAATRLLALALALAWGLTVLGIERSFPGQGWVSSPAEFVAFNLGQWRVWGVLGIMAVPLLVALPCAWRRAPAELRRAALVTLPYVALHVAMAKCDEARYWLNLYVLFGPFLGLCYQSPGDRPSPGPDP